MNFIGRKIYFDKLTGNVILDTGEKTGAVRQTTVDEDFQVYTDLQQRVKDTVGVIELEYGQYSQDFMQCSGYRVNITSNKLEFSYPDPNAPQQPQEPTYQKPLSEQVKELQQSVIELSMMLSTPQV